MQAEGAMKWCPACEQPTGVVKGVSTVIGQPRFLRVFLRCPCGEEWTVERLNLPSKE
jgi:hypothetical protein